jgi:hypothetical protein
MKLTKSRLKQLIKEELKNVISEATPPWRPASNPATDFARHINAIGPAWDIIYRIIRSLHQSRCITELEKRKFDYYAYRIEDAIKAGLSNRKHPSGTGDPDLEIQAARRGTPLQQFSNNWRKVHGFPFLNRRCVHHNKRKELIKQSDIITNVLETVSLSVSG